MPPVSSKKIDKLNIGDAVKTAEKDADKTEKSSADEPKVDIFDDGI